MSDDIRTKPTTDAYRDGWERMFGKPPKRYGKLVYKVGPDGLPGAPRIEWSDAPDGPWVIHGDLKP